MKYQALLLRASLFSLLALGLCVPARAERDVDDVTFNFDATKLVYTVVEYSVDATQNYTVQFSEIWAADADGKNVRRITQGHTNGDARVSPDNNKFAFVRRGDIWIADGKGACQITKTSDANETKPEFSNDGKTLFFIRSDILDSGAKTSDGLKITVPGSGKVITYSLVSGEERERFAGQDDIQQIVPNRADANEVFLLYRFYDPKAKTEWGEGALTQTILAGAKLDGSARRILQTINEKTQTEKFKTEIKNLQSAGGGLLAQTETTTYSEKAGFSTTNKFVVHSKTGPREIEEPPFNFGDIARDGNLIVGVGAVFVGEGDARDVVRSIRFYNRATETGTSLDRSTLLSLKPAPLAAKPNDEIPARDKVHFDKGEAHLKIGATGDALEEFSEAIKLHPNYAKAYLKRGAVYAKRLEFQDAITDFDAAIRLRPADGEAYMARGAAYQELDETEKAISDYTDATVFSEHPAQAYRRRAVLLRKQGFLKLAEKDEWDAKKPENQ